MARSAKTPASTPAPAKKSAGTALAKAKPTGTALANIDAELAGDIANIKNQIGQPSGNKLKNDVDGSFLTPEGLNLGTEIQIVVLDFINRNFFYTAAYNPNQISPPDCYAMGKDRTTMAPEDDSPDKQNDKCITCPMNQFKSGVGNAKACQNRYWLSVLVVDPENPDAHNEPDAPIYLLDLSPSNLKSFEGVVAHAARSLNGPMIKALVTVSATPVGNYSKLTFTDLLPNPDYALHVSRRPETVDALMRRPDFTAAAAPPPPRGRGAQAPARRAGARR